ncbi:bifunctional phosphoribosyl-AMP cyclohydrolase/phosphoribosyl-ATP diphosphatase HisIE [Patescibacteria group bacterium]
MKNLNFNKMNGLIPAIVQDSNTMQVLMLGFMNQEALKKTLKDKKVTFWSRTKKRLWQKGQEESGNFLEVESITSDCDNDTLLIMAKPKGPTCHTGSKTCFNSDYSKQDFLDELCLIIKDRKLNLPKKSYTTSLFNEGLSKILEKVDEESKEVIYAAENESKNRLIEEISDLYYHVFVLMAQKDVTLAEIREELLKRNR